MNMITVTAKTLDEAITKALIELGTTSDNLDYEVIEKGSSGFLGLFGKDAVIRAKKKKEDDDLEAFLTTGKIDTEPKEPPKTESKDQPKETSKETPKKNSQKGQKNQQKAQKEAAASEARRQNRSPNLKGNKVNHPGRLWRNPRRRRQPERLMWKPAIMRPRSF